MTQTTELLRQFYSNFPGEAPPLWLTLWTRQDKKTYWYPTNRLNDAEKKAIILSSDEKDVYFGVGLRKDKLKKGRGSSEDVAAIPGLWMDVDVTGDAHKQEDLPPDIKRAVQLLEEFPFKPSLLIHSGHGLHGYWLFKEPWIFESEEERQQGDELLSLFQGTVRANAAKKGWKLDNTSDLSRVLRVPGTMNYKDAPVPVEVLDNNDNRYNPSDFGPYLLDWQAIKNATSKASEQSSGQNKNIDVQSAAGPVSLVIENCAFIQYCRDNAAKLPEPEWYAMVANMARGLGGPEKIHEFSKPYPKYNPAETDEKIKHAIEDGQPHGCAYIQTELGFSACPKNGCDVNAPISFAVSKTVKARLITANITKKTEKEIFSSPEIIGALAILKKDDPGHYAIIKKSLKDSHKGKLSLNDLERAINKKIAENQQLRVLEKKKKVQKLEDSLADIPLKGLKLPWPWNFNENGVWMQKTSKDGVTETICACPVPAILSRRLKNIDTGDEKLELSFYRDKSWHQITADRASVFNRQGLIQLGNKGLPVSSESAKHLIKFFDDLERDNLDVFPLTRSISRMGWIGRKRFLPGVADDIRLDIEEGSGTASIANGYREKGSLDGWAKTILPISDYPLARFTLAASFAAPLLRVFGERVFVLHLWGPSRGGKSAALVAAQSVWGNPDDITANFNTTKVGLERLAAFFCDLPLGIDEKQVAGDKQEFIESLVYLIGLGKGKVRGAKDGGLQQFNQWKTIALTTGEEPITRYSSAGGIKTRTLELYGKPVPNEEYASQLHNETKKNFGLAGPLFIKEFLKRSEKNLDSFRKEFEYTKKILTEKHKENISSHIAAVATVCMADYYANQWIFKKDEKTAGDEAMALGEYVISLLESAGDIDEALRAYEYIISWYHINQNFFADEVSREKYGTVDIINNKLMIYPPIFERAMDEAKFNSIRILKDWGSKLNLIETETRTGENKTRYRVRKWDQQERQMKYYIVIKMPEGKENE